MQNKQKYQKNKNNQMSQIIALFECLGNILKKEKLFEAYHFMMISRMSFEDIICLRKENFERTAVSR
ncbi:MAG: hypothetical protein ACI4RJ_05925 [Alphaproteobacteria bacterium]